MIIPPIEITKILVADAEVPVVLAIFNQNFVFIAYRKCTSRIPNLITVQFETTTLGVKASPTPMFTSL